MNEHDELEPTVAMPRVGEQPAPVAPEALPAPPIQPQPIPPQPIPARTLSPTARPVFRFGNPLIYALRRFLAFGLDFVVITGVATMLLYGLIAINPFSGLPNNSEGGFDATVGMGAATALVSIWVLESLFGTTLGKLAFSLHVYVPKHRFVGFGRALIRNVLRPLDFLVIGWILAMAPGHRRVGDLLSGTVVAHSPLRAFSPLVGWMLIVALAAVPFLIGGGSITVLAVASAFLEFIPPLAVRIVHTLLQLVPAPALHQPPSTG